MDAPIANGPAIAPDGTVYFGTDYSGVTGVKPYSGTLYAIRENNGGLMRGGWPKSYGSPTNDGRAPNALASRYGRHFAAIPAFVITSWFTNFLGVNAWRIFPAEN